MRQEKKFYTPNSLEEALQTLCEDPQGFLIFAGGTDLFAGIKGRPQVRDDRKYLRVTTLPELRQITLQENMLMIGASVTLSEILNSDLCRQHAELLCQAVRQIASPLIRNMGTIAGNVINASPAGDGLTAMYCLQAVAELSHWQDGSIVTRELPVCELIMGPSRTALAEGEIVTCFKLPSTQGLIAHYEKVGLRNALAISVMGLGILKTETGEIVHLSLGALGPRVIISQEAEELLRQGEKQRAIDCYMGTLSPIGDLRATAEYRRMVAKKLLESYILGVE